MMNLINESKINSIIQYAYDNNDYYYNTYKKEGLNPYKSKINDYFFSLPILNKDKVLLQPDNFISRGFDKKSLIHDRTSGSTGKILNIYWEKKDRIRSLMSLWSKRKILHGILPDSKCCYFHSIAYRTTGNIDHEQIFSPKVLIRDNGTIISFSKLDFSDRMLDVYYRNLIEFKPEWLLCYPSTLYLFSQYIENNNLPRIESIKYIELTGEYLIQSYRSKIEQVFQASTSNEYGSREFNGIAYECKYGNLHCLNQNVFVEIIFEGKNIGYNHFGDICITGLNNCAMPLIRYDLGDCGILIEGETCHCGDKNPILVIKNGRSNDIIEFNDGTIIDCAVFFYVIEQINTEFNNEILQFQIIRKGENKFDVLLVIDKFMQCNETTERIKNIFSNEIKKYGFTKSEFYFDFRKNVILDHKSGKLNFFIDEMRKVDKY